MSEGTSAAKPHPEHSAPAKEAPQQAPDAQKASPNGSGQESPVLKDWASI